MTEDGREVEQWVSDPRFELNEVQRPRFSAMRKGGVDPTEVDAYLTRLERLLKDFVAFTRELETRVAHAKGEARDAADMQHRAVDEAMIAVLETKERILVEAEERAWEIEQDARRRGMLSVGEASAEAQSAVSELHRRIDRYEDQVVGLEAEVLRWRTAAERLATEADHRPAVVDRPAPPAAPTWSPQGQQDLRALIAASLTESQADLHRQIALIADQVADSERSVDAGGEVRAAIDDALRQARETADRSRHDAEQLLDVVRRSTEVSEQRSADLFAAAQQARDEAAQMRTAAEETRRRADEDVARMMAEAAAMLNELRAGSPPPAEELSEPAAPNPEPAPASRQDPESRLSRYTRQSAQLPRIGEHADAADHSFASLRRKGKARPPDAN